MKITDVSTSALHSSATIPPLYPHPLSLLQSRDIDEDRENDDEEKERIEKRELRRRKKEKMMRKRKGE